MGTGTGTATFPCAMDHGCRPVFRNNVEVAIAVVPAVRVPMLSSAPLLLEPAMPANPVIHFEIPVHDMSRAIGFYEHVFELALESADVDGNEMAFFPFSEGAAGASGALAKGESYLPGMAGPRIYFSVQDVAATLQRALAAGGCLHYPVTDVPGYGRVAEFLDVEGNVIALHSAFPEPSTGSTPAPGSN